MTLENQVTSLEISKRLKELGVRQESLWYWNAQGELEYANPETWVGYTTDFSAFTVAELGEMLPWEILGTRRSELTITKDGTKKPFSCYYEVTDVDTPNPILGNVRFEDESEANARGKMLIYLLENKLLTTSPSSTNK